MIGNVCRNKDMYARHLKVSIVVGGERSVSSVAVFSGLQ